MKAYWNPGLKTGRINDLAAYGYYMRQIKNVYNHVVCSILGNSCHLHMSKDEMETNASHSRDHLS